jgi:hypothetical protein
MGLSCLQGKQIRLSDAPTAAVLQVRARRAHGSGD